MLYNLVVRLYDLMPKLSEELQSKAKMGIDEAVKQLEALHAASLLAGPR